MNGVLRDHNPFNLDFMLREDDDKVEEYRDQILDMANLSDQQMLQEFFENQGLSQIKCVKNFH